MATRKPTSKAVRTKRRPVDVTGRPTWPDGVTLTPKPGRKPAAKAPEADASGEDESTSDGGE